MSAAAGAQGAGSALSIYGNYKSDMAEAKAMAQNADAYEQEAAELWRRAQLNVLASRREEGEAVAAQTEGFVMGGVELTAGTPLDVMADTNLKVSRQIGYDLEQAAMQRNMLETKAKQARQAAKDTKKSAKIAAVGGVIGAVGKAGM